MAEFKLDKINYVGPFTCSGGSILYVNYAGDAAFVQIPSLLLGESYDGTKNELILPLLAKKNPSQ